MAWTAAQLAKARKMYKARGNKKSWSECIAAVTKGGKVSGTKKKAAPRKKAVSGTRKTTPRKTTVVKARAKQVNVKVGGIGSIALNKVKGAQEDIARLEKMKKSAPTASERKQIAGAISGLKKFKNSFKKFL